MAEPEVPETDAKPPLAVLADMQSARIGIARADMYPAFRLIGTVGYAADGNGDLFESDSTFGLGSFGFNWKFLNYGRLRNNVRLVF